MPIPVSDPEILEAHARATLDGLHVAEPARVDAYHPATQTVDCTPLCKKCLFFEDDSSTFEDKAQVQNVPVALPRGGGFCVSMPLDVGDIVWLVYSHVPTGEAQQTGDTAEPTDTRTHGPGYPVAFPVSFADPRAIADAAAGDSLIIGRDGDPAQIVIPKAGGTVQIGKGATDYAALASKVDAVFHAMATWAPSGTVADGTALKTLLTPIIGTGSTYTVAASVTKVK